MDRSIIARALPVIALIVALSIIEALIPLRRQSRTANARLATNVGLILTTLALAVPLNITLAVGAAYAATNDLGVLPWLGLSGIGAAIVAVILLDLAAYAAHVFLHKVSWAWRLHRIHHSDASVDATTSLRQHPVEGLVRFSFTAAVAWSLGAPAGVIAIYRTLSSVNAVFEHSNIRVPRWLDRALVWFWVTPDMHKIHHSRVRRETDSNYANLLSLCDRLFGTYTPRSTAGAVHYGLDDDAGVPRSYLEALRAPFRQGNGRANGVQADEVAR